MLSPNITYSSPIPMFGDAAPLTTYPPATYPTSTFLTTTSVALAYAPIVGDGGIAGLTTNTGDAYSTLSITTLSLREGHHVVYLSMNLGSLIFMMMATRSSPSLGGVYTHLDKFIYNLILL